MDLVTASIYVAKAGAPKVAAYASRLLAKKVARLRLARAATAAIAPPRPLWVLNRWLGTPAAVQLLAAPDQPGEHQVEELDRVLCAGSDNWCQLSPEDRRERAEVMLVKVYERVLRTYDVSSAVAISSERGAALGHRIEATVLDVAASLAQMDVANDKHRLDDRLTKLPPGLNSVIKEVWLEESKTVGQVVTALTDPESRPTSVLAAWEQGVPDWLAQASWAVRLIAAELAWSYGRHEFAANMMAAVADDGAPRRAYWWARAALLRFENGDTDAATVASAAAMSVADTDEMMPQVVAAMLAGDGRTANVECERWAPRNAMEERVRAAVRLRLLAADSATLTAAMIEEALSIVAEIQQRQPSSAFLFVRARLLTLRVRMSESPYRDRDLREARELALQVRDERRQWRGDSAAAAALACHAALLAANLDEVLHIGTISADGATSEEANAPEVAEAVAVAAVLRGNLELARERAQLVTAPFARAHLDGLLAQAEGRDPGPSLREALEHASDDEQRAQALRALARCGHDELPGLDDFAGRHPEAAEEIRAVHELATNRTDTAIGRLRRLRRTSLTAAMSLAQAYHDRGDLDSFVETLREAAEVFKDYDLRFEAAVALLKADRYQEAEAELRTLTSAGAEWNGRTRVFRLLADLAMQDEQYHKATTMLEAAVQAAPQDERHRWALINVLTRRADFAGAWRTYRDADTPMQPQAVEEAQLWVELHRRNAPADRTFAGCIRLLQQFAWSEQFSAFALIALLGPGSPRDTLPEHLLASLHAEINRFNTTWPSSPYLSRLPFDDPTAMMAKLTELTRPPQENRHALKEIDYQARIGQMPIGIVAAITRRSYAELVVTRLVGLLPARHPAEAEEAECIRAGEASLDGDIVIDTTAAAVLAVLPTRTREALLTVFRRVLATDDALRDAHAANDNLAGRSTSSLYYDEELGSLRLTERSPEEANRRATEAAEVLAIIQAAARHPRPKARLFPDAGSRWDACLATLDLARDMQLPVWADDFALRAIAREAGVPTVSTAALLDVLRRRGLIGARQHEGAIRAMIRADIGDFPLDRHRLTELAAEDGWHPRSVARALARPGAWINATSTMELYFQLLNQVAANTPQDLPDWLYAAVLGATLNAADPLAASDVASRLLAATIGKTATRVIDASPLASVTRAAVRDGAAPGAAASPDPIPLAATLLRDIYAKYMPLALATQHVLGLFANLPSSDRQVILRALIR